MAVLKNLSCVVLDMDGVLFIGERLRLGIRELIEQLTRAHIEYHVLTNMSASTASEISANLAGMGLTIADERITNASEITVSYILERSRPGTVFTLGGGSGLAHALRTRGLEQIALEQLDMRDVEKISNAVPRPAVPLILGWTREYNFELATRLVRLETCISDVYTASADRYFADEGGYSPAVAWLSGSVSALLGKVPINPAKPNPYALQYVLTKVNAPAARTAVIGDSLSDIQSGNIAGCKSILLLGGATSSRDLENLEGTSVPSRVISELTELLA